MVKREWIAGKYPLLPSPLQNIITVSVCVLSPMRALQSQILDVTSTPPPPPPPPPPLPQEYLTALEQNVLGLATHLEQSSRRKTTTEKTGHWFRAISESESNDTYLRTAANDLGKCGNIHSLVGEPRPFFLTANED